MATTNEDVLESSASPPYKLNARVIGYNGLAVTGGLVLEECDAALRWPQCQYTFKKMLKDATVGMSVEAAQTSMTRIPWYVAPAEGKENDEVEKERTQKIQSMMGDMREGTWLSFMKQASSFVPYGFSVHEVIPYTRLKVNGSRYNDGLLGIKKLALRSQDTIVGVEYKNKGRDFVGYWQRVNKITNKGESRYSSDIKPDNKTDVLLPINRILAFRNSPVKDSPYGSSPLVTIYEAWKYLKAYEDAEAHGVNSDVHGLKVLYMPPQYMQEDADPKDAAVYEAYKAAMRNLHIGQESGLILPQVLDDRGEQYFKFEVMSVTGSKSHNIAEIIERYRSQIITALNAAHLVAGQSGGGSFALSESLISIQEKVIESKLEEIRDVLNHRLIPMIYEWNGWETEQYPTFEFGDVSEETLDEFSKAIQRIGAVKLLPRTVKVVNAITKRLGLSDFLDDSTTQEDLEKILGNPPEMSKSGQGMSSGMPNGTGDSTGSSGDDSAGNTENA